MCRRRVVISVAVLVGALLCANGGLGAGDLLCLAPAMLLLAALLGRRYPGERLLLAFTARARRGRRRCAARVAASHGRVAEVPRGGLLMGFALAVRPPPCSPALS